MLHSLRFSQKLSKVAFILLVCGCFVWHQCEAQFGIGGRYSIISDGYWQEVFAQKNSNYSDELSTVYAMYWFRLKQKRIEFLPEIGYVTSLNKNVSTGPPNNLKAFYLQFNTDIYFLDFESDCNCPTFSKQNDVLQRGLFLEVGAGVEFQRLGIDYLDGSSGELGTQNFKRTMPKIYGGLGFDIGMSDLITITPTIGVAYLTGQSWDGVEQFMEVEPTGITGDPGNDVVMYAGIRMLLRPDYVSGRRR